MTTQEVVLNGINFSVEFDIDTMKDTLSSLKKDFEGQYTKMYTVDEVVTQEEFEQDIEQAENLIKQLESNSFDLTEHVEQIRKKKNKKFWSNSGHDIMPLANISEYFTDFTNAWRVMVFRLEVVNETVCTLTLRGRTYTY